MQRRERPRSHERAAPGRRSGAVLIALLLCSTAAAQDVDASARADAFEKRIRPVLATHCLECHGPHAQEAGLRLDSRAAVLKGSDNGPVVIPGKPGESLLVQAIRHEGDVQMPPAGKLEPHEIAALTAWIEQGVFWPEDAGTQPANAAAADPREHWAFQAVSRPAVPSVPGDAWSQSPIDRFIIRKLEPHGLAPAAPATRPTLLRRVTFDLVGLPPSAEEIADFLSDESPDAIAKVIDRLLASPHYGERWGRHWLDVARYADNKGYVFFQEKAFPWAWAYRDYVVRAFNEDLPYDRFVLEQLAADQLDVSAEPWRLAAMGFLTVGGRFMDNIHDIVDDRIDVVARGLLGLTVTCARCHDHKFDPIPQADYYSLYGVFRSSVEPTLPPLLHAPPDTEEYRAFDREMTSRLEKLNAYITSKHLELVTSARTRAAEYLLAAHAQRDQPPTDGFMLLADPGDLNPAMTLRWQVLLDRTRRRHHPVWGAWHTLAELPAEQFAANSANVLSELASSASSEKPVNPLILEELTRAPLATFSDVATRYAELLNRIEAEWQRVVADAQSGGSHPPEALSDPDEEQLRRVFHGPEAPPEVPATFGWGFLTLLPDRAAQEEYKKLLKEVETWSTTGPGAPPRAMVLVDEASPHEPRIFQRGNPNRPGGPVPRQFLACLEPDRQPFQHGSGRLELARAIVARANPLTARVMANRIWLQHFGAGLVTTPGDFGLRGEPASHPELLDWLAVELVEGQGSRDESRKNTERWSVKRLHRMILHAAVYQQASHSGSRPSILDSRPSADPENRLLARFPRRRLEFEALRDSLLAVSGSLDRIVGGPSVDIVGGGFVTRRTIYGSIDRLDVPGLLTTFDFPNPAATAPQRSETTVAPQALFLMNNEFAAEAARRLAARPDAIGQPAVDERLRRMFLIAFGREPHQSEREIAGAFLGAEPSDADWEQFAQALLMSNEFAFVD